MIDDMRGAYDRLDITLNFSSETKSDGTEEKQGGSLAHFRLEDVKLVRLMSRDALERAESVNSIRGTEAAMNPIHNPARARGSSRPQASTAGGGQPERYRGRATSRGAEIDNSLDCAAFTMEMKVPDDVFRWLSHACKDKTSLEVVPVLFNLGQWFTCMLPQPYPSSWCRQV